MRLEWIALALVEGVGPALFRQLLARFGSPREVLHAPIDALIQVPRVSFEIARQIHEMSKRLDQLQEELSQLAERGVTILTWYDDAYPSNLKLITTSPPVLFVRGNVLERDAYAIAIVGSRQASFAGLKVARDLAMAFAERGWTVVSGLAAGIDSAAHKGALDAGGRTFAALGSGILVPENPQLAMRIERSGALLSELPPTAGVSVPNWLARNRIVTGLALGTIMVEGAERSGSVHAARNALKQRRMLFIVHWNDDAEGHAGNRLMASRATCTIPPDASIVDQLIAKLKGHYERMHLT
ncbi:MAG TPA: DNA-processing protein DprA [Armatimonadetes bacterium]|nr:DNA-processing protein DprA [Armatimonadota bacterium]